MFALVFGLFGLVIGSFLNVVILRHGAKPVTGRSACPHCGRVLKWYDMVPVFSWLVLAGRCRSCNASISIQYPLVEAATALCFALIGGIYVPVDLLALASMVLACAIVSFFIIIFVYDLYHKLIPDEWVWPLVGLSFLYALVQTVSLPAGLPQWPLLIGGIVVALPILLLWYLSLPFTGAAGQWMGFGDVKLSLAIGWLLGPYQGLTALWYAFVIGAVVSVLFLLVLPRVIEWCGLRNSLGHLSYTMKSEVPFGPFLIVAALLVWFALLWGVSLPLSFA